MDLQLMPTNMKLHVKVGNFYWLPCDRGVEIKAVYSDSLDVVVGTFNKYGEIVKFSPKVWNVTYEVLDDSKEFSDIEDLKWYLMSAYVL